MRRLVIACSSVVLSAAIVAGSCANGADTDRPSQSPQGKQLWHEATGTGPAPTVPTSNSLAPLIKQLKPAVVNISTTTVVKNPHHNLRVPGMGENDQDDLFRRFFGFREMPQEFKGTSLGSGFIINEEGYILTNNHVVKDATDIKVRLSDGREFEAKIVGRDPATDVALIRLKGLKGKLPTVALGDSDALDQGDFVVAIGSPFGFRESATFGVISAKDRQLTGGPFDDFLQTDAAINQGNSGGPLFDLKGEVVGINSAIVSPQIGSGIGFAVPINLAKQLIPQLLQGKVRRGYLGVSVSEVTPDLAQGFGLSPDTKGAVVQNVAPRSPASRAGIQPGDVIVGVNGKLVGGASELTRSISSVPPGGKATLSLFRSGKKRDVQVTVAQRPDEEALARGEMSPEEGGAKAPAGKEGAEKLGVRVAPLTPEVAREFGVQGGQGVIVVQVTPDGPADKAGVQRGDVILKVGDQQVDSVEQIVSAIGKIKPGAVALLRIRRGQQAQFVAVRLGGEKK
jgi:serine protease Do